jgi:hypothetical protein
LVILLRSVENPQRRDLRNDRARKTSLRGKRRDGLLSSELLLWRVVKDSRAVLCAYIRSLIGELFGKVAAQKVQILYGGSVKPNNIHDYLQAEDVDGALVGGASLKPASFQELLENI